MNIKNKAKIISIITTVLLCTGILYSNVYATAKDISIDAKLSQKRYLNGVPTKAYKIKNTSEDYIFQILSVDGNNNIKDTNLYCLNQAIGLTWYGTQNGAKVHYDKAYDMVTQKNEISSLNISSYSNVVKTNYNQLMWIIDHMYVGENGISKTQLLKNAGIVWGNNDLETAICWHYNSSTQVWNRGYEGYYVIHNGKQKDVILSIDEIQAIQQAAIWHYTNGNNSNFNLYTTDKLNSPGIWFEYTESETGIKDIDDEIKAIKQEQAAILYNYFIDGANSAKNGYTTYSEGSITLKYTDSNKKIETEGSNYKIGPLKIEATGNTTITGLKVTTGNNNKDITSKISVTGTNKTTPEVNKSFYIMVPKTEAQGEIKVTVNGNWSAIQKTLLIKNVSNNSSVEQPLLQYKQTTGNISDSVIATPEKLFDFALRKTVYKVNGKTDYINEEGKSAKRTINIDESTIPDTALYKHRKDPIVVAKGDTVTYQIHIYNEGDIDGYATKIVDQLPKGLESTTNSTITSSKGNIYTVNYNKTKNKIELVINKKVKALKAYIGTGNPDNDTIELTCEVKNTAIEKGKAKRYLTNIAYISEEEDIDGNKISQDRKNKESKVATNPVNTKNITAEDLNSTDANSYKGNSSNQSVYNDTNNNYYYKGEEDDDDFEKIVVIQEFDLKLMKYISTINGEKNDRNIVIDTSKLKTRSKTTANYNVSKEPLTAETGDYVLYTFVVYNEGEVNGYVEEITENIPEGLEYVYSEKTGSALENDTSLSEVEKFAIKYNQEQGWGKQVNSNGKKIITTKYLSKAKGSKNLINAFDSENDNGKGSGLSSKGVSVIFKVVSKDTKNIIRNEAAITEICDEDGKKVKDRDSKPEEWKKENSSDLYNNNSNYPKYKEDDEDYDNLKILKFDLKLLKYVSKVNGNKTNREITVDSSLLKNGQKTTANYNVSKEPISVETGDILTYTFRVYNEGEISGYAEEITENIPEGLEYDASKNEGTIWNISKDGKTIKTNHLSRLNGTTNLIKAFDTKNDNGKGSGLSYKEVSVNLKVVAKNTKSIIRNEAEISKEVNESGNEVTDIDSKPEEWKKENSSDLYNNNSNYPKYKEDDEDYDNIKIIKLDFALRKFISKVSKNIKFDESTTVINRAPIVDSSKIKAGTANTAIYKHSKSPLTVDTEDFILYTLRVYNEGEIDGYASQITDYLPEYLEFVTSTDTNIKEINDNWSYDATTRKVTTKPTAKNATTLIKAFDSKNDDGKGSGLSYLDLQIVCRINNKAVSGKKVTNIAEITEYKNKDGIVKKEDIDSSTNNLVYPENPEKYKDDEMDKEYIPGQEDDDDFEKVLINTYEEPSIHKGVKTVENQDSGYNINEEQTWAIRTNIPGDIIRYKKYQIVDEIDFRLDFSGIEKISIKIGNTELVKDKDYKIDFTKNDNGISEKTNSGILKITFIDLENQVNVSETVTNNIGNKIDVTFKTTFAKDDKGNLIAEFGTEIPNQAKLIYNNSLKEEIIKTENPEIHTGGVTLYKYALIKENKKALEGAEFAIYKTEQDAKNQTNPIMTAKSDEYGIVRFIGLQYGGDAENSETNKTQFGTYKYDSTKQNSRYFVVETKAPDGYSYSTTPIEVIINSTSYEESISKIKYQIQNNKKVFDLALKKFITNVSGIEGSSRVPKVSFENGKIIYTHPKNIINVTVGDVVTYTIRAYNEGEIAGYAQKITDNIPDYLEFIPDNSINNTYRWMMLDKNGNYTKKATEAVKVVTDFTSKQYGETLMKKNNLTQNPNLLNAFNKNIAISEQNPDYIDIKIAFKVKDPKSNTVVITNNAQISDDADENGNPIEDEDSTPDVWKDGEDDQDYENVKVKYFDLALQKYVIKAIVKENGKTKIIKTGNTGAETDVMPKVEIYRKNVYSTSVKFVYTIKVINQGDIQGYAKELKDYVPNGLKFYREDNKGWKDEGNNIISTTALKDTLLKPGESTTINVTLRWVNGDNNLGVKTNVAEISKDYNKKGIKDKDSTINNKKLGEDDIDEAPVLLTISTGSIENTITYISITLGILSILGIGIFGIKKYVL